MSTKDRLWKRFPPFIWGEGSFGHEDEMDELTGTQYLTHTRHPRFICEYDDADDDIDDVQVMGTGPHLTIQANGFLFTNFIFIDPPDIETVAEVCRIAACCRHELDVAAEEQDDDDDAESPLKRAENYLIEHGEQVHAAMASYFPRGWEQDWTTKRHRGEVVLTHQRGYKVVVADGECELSGLLPARSLIARLRAQSHRLTNPAPPELLVAHELAVAEAEDEEAAEIVENLCPDCQAAYDAFMKEMFPAGWRAHWAVEADGLKARRDDGYAMHVRAATGRGAEIDGGGELILFHNGVEITADADVGEGERAAAIAAVQATSVLVEMAPEKIALRQTAHHGGDEGDGDLLSAVMDAIDDHFPPGWEDRWQVLATEEGKTAIHLSGARMVRAAGDEMRPVVPPQRMSPKAASSLFFQARALLFSESPAGAVRAVVMAMGRDMIKAFLGIEPEPSDETHPVRRAVRRTPSPRRMSSTRRG